MQDLLVSAIDSFSAKREKEGYQLMVKFIDQLQYQVQNYDEETVEKMNGILSQVLIGMEQKDYSLICDLLEYEIMPLLSDRSH